MADESLPIKKTGWTAWFSVLRNHQHICCGCDLVHDVEQRILPDGTIEERWKTNNRATAARRRKK